MAAGCSFQSSEQESLWSDYERLIPMTEGPTYQLLEGYNPLWLSQVKEGVELARSYWGTYGPTHILVLGEEDGQVISAESKKSFLDEYCKWRRRLFVSFKRKSFWANGAWRVGVDAFRR